MYTVPRALGRVPRVAAGWPKSVDWQRSTAESVDMGVYEGGHVPVLTVVAAK